MTDTVWQRVSPLAILFYLGQTMIQLGKSIWQLAVPATAVFLTTDFVSVPQIIIACGFALSGLFAYAIAAYWRTRFRLDAHQLVLRTGVFRRRQLNLDYARVQSVAAEQNLLYRLTGVVDIRLDSPGSAAEEARLPAVAPAVADELRERIRSQRKVATPNVLCDDPPSLESTGFSVLTTLRGYDFIRIGIASNRALVLLALAGSAWGTLASQGKKINLPFFDPLESWLITLDWIQWLLLIPSALIAIVLCFMLLSIVGAWFRFSDFKLLAGDDTLQTRAGLLTRHEQTVSLQKVQQLRMSRGLLHRWMNIASVRIHQIGSSAGATHLDVPLTRASLFAEIVRRCVSPTALRDGRYQPDYGAISKHYLTARWRLIGAIPAIAMATLMMVRSAPALAYGLPVLWLITCIAISYVRYRRHGYLFDDDVIATRRGLAQTHTTVMAPNRVQAVQYKQSPFQRRRGLVTLNLITASGTTKLPFLEIVVADRGAELCLNAAARTDLRWH